MNGLLARTKVFCDGIDHCEDIAIHPDGSIWAGGEAGQIYRISPDGNKVEEVANTGGFILGIAFSPGAKWLAICDLGNKCLWKMDPESLDLQVFARGVQGHAFQIPNYAAFDNEGSLYVSESGAFRAVTGKILKFAPNGAGEIWHSGPFNFANGLAIDSRGEWLYVVCSWLPGVERIKIDENGKAGSRQVFATIPKTVPDGLAFDSQGNLYISCYAPNAIYCVGPDQTIVQLLDDWEAHTLSNPTNMAFGGAHFDQLFTSNLGRWHISQIDLGQPGLPLPSHSKSVKKVS